MLVADTLSAQAKERTMRAGSVGLAEGHRPHVRDAAELLKKGLASVSARDIARCFVEANTLPLPMEAELSKAHGKARGSVVDPDLKAFADTLDTISTSVHSVQQQGCHVQDEEICDILESLGITPGQPADKAVMKAVRVWGTVEDQEGVVEAMRTDAAEELTASLSGIVNGGIAEEQEEDDEDGGESSGFGSGAPLPYSELSPHFGTLERAAQDSGNASAALHLSRARMEMLAAHANKRTRQADLREFLPTR
ncbi:unnamed protein product [Scytosiphon promiscuus]